MKRIILLFMTIVSFVGLLTASSEKNNDVIIAFSLDTNGNYTGFSNLPKNYTVEDAEKDGYFVKRDLEVIVNNEVWDNFVETSRQGNNTGIRMASFYTEDTNSPYFSDIFFNDGFYYLFDSSSDNQEKQPFLYLLALEGRFGGPLVDCEVVILTNDNALTFDVVMKSMYSSSMDYIQSVSPYTLINFLRKPLINI